VSDLRVPFLKPFLYIETVRIYAFHTYYTLSYMNTLILCKYTCLKGATRWRSWLMHCATSQKVAGSIPHGVSGFFIDIILPAALWPCGRPSKLTGFFLEGKGSPCVGLTTLPPSPADCLQMWEPQPLGNLRAWPSL
jgi:hypothetical protein